MHLDKAGLRWLVLLLLLVGCVPVRVPGGKTGKAPFKADGFAMVIVHETEDLAKLTEAQRQILTSSELRGWLKSKNCQWRQLDKDAETTNEPQWAKDAMACKRESTPWLLVANGKKGFSGPLPGSVTETLAVLKKIGGG
jgi:hypothetical protein